MLVLSRRIGEEIVIGDELIVVRVEEINGNRVRLSLDAPEELVIHRKEVFDRIRRQDQEDGKS